MLRLYQMIDLLPISVKLEIAKEYLQNLYIREKYLINEESSNMEYYMPELEDKYNHLFDLIKCMNFSDEEKCKLYYWAKLKRKELNLEDNIYNVCDFSINNNIRFDDANDIINNKKTR